jgi:CelD/BcsL family acetyltransferase involved in cellulose biosynthesis
MTDGLASGAAPGSMRAVVIRDPAELEPHLAAWDGLAVASGRPFCAPAWMLAWWRHARTGTTELRVVLVFDGDRLAGVAPLFAQIWGLGVVEMRILGAGFCHRVGLVATPGDEAAMAAVLAATLAEMKPASVVFEGIDAEDPWPDLVADAWPGRRPRLRSDLVMDAPSIQLDADFDAWMERRERRFRKEARRTARRMEEEGVQSRTSATPEDLEALLRLHYARWDERGGSNVETSARGVLRDAARELGESGRLAVALLDGPEGPVAAELMLTAGDTMVFWAGGFDPSWSRHAPGTQAMLLALREAAASGVRTADLGGGEHAYKERLADSNRPIVWRTVFPRGARYPLIRARLAPKQLRQGAYALAKRMPPGLQARIRSLVRR